MSLPGSRSRSNCRLQEKPSTQVLAEQGMDSCRSLPHSLLRTNVCKWGSNLSFSHSKNPTAFLVSSPWTQRILARLSVLHTQLAIAVLIKAFEGRLKRSRAHGDVYLKNYVPTDGFGQAWKSVGLSNKNMAITNMRAGGVPLSGLTGFRVQANGGSETLS